MYSHSHWLVIFCKTNSSRVRTNTLYEKSCQRTERLLTVCSCYLFENSKTWFQAVDATIRENVNFDFWKIRTRCVLAACKLWWAVTLSIFCILSPLSILPLQYRVHIQSCRDITQVRQTFRLAEETQYCGYPSTYVHCRIHSYIQTLTWVKILSSRFFVCVADEKNYNSWMYCQL